MKFTLITAVMSLAAFGATAAVAQDNSHYDQQRHDDTSGPGDSSGPGTYVKDSLITTKVKSKLAAKHLSTLTNIKVDTDQQGVVWLSGTAPTKDAKDMAGMIARDTDGVTGVHNKIEVSR
jgi:hyperosmotically inducible protein